jgi:polyisoprenoid-binding protein YceI
MTVDLQARPTVQDLAGTWKIDPAHTGITFSAKHMMVSTVRGRFDEFEGTFTIDPDDLSRSSAEVTIQAASLSTSNPDRDAHLRSADFIDADAHPTLSFRSTSVDRVSEEDGTFRLTGDLSIRGVTRPVTLEGRFEGLLAKDLWGATRAAFAASTVINRRDWNLTWNRAMETGGVLVGDKVTLELEVTATRVA